MFLLESVLQVLYSLVVVLIHLADHRGDLCHRQGASRGVGSAELQEALHLHDGLHVLLFHLRGGEKKGQVDPQEGKQGSNRERERARKNEREKKRREKARPARESEGKEVGK